MALRITQSQLAPEPDPEPELPPQEGSLASVEERQLAGDLLIRAGELLRESDTSGYVKLFETASALENIHLRYLTHKLLMQQALLLTREVNERQATALFLGLAHGAVIALEQNPAEPLLLNYAGVAFYELWSLEGARALFKAAQRLDPNLTHVDQNLKAISERNRSHGPRKAALHPSLRGLTARAVQIGRRAKPAQGLKLSLCMIVRDEEEMLPRSLAAAAPAVDEIVIVDTGSQDRTIEIAKSFGANVIEREWTGDFSAARNAGLEAATGDWILYLDADEVLVKDDVEKLRALTGQTWREAMYLQETNYTGVESAGTAVQHNALRVFRNRPEYRFRGALHEQMAWALPADMPERIAETSVRIEHYGYLGVVRAAKDKSRRNLEILQEQMKITPPDAFARFNLGAEYSALEDYAAALPEYEESWRMALEVGTTRLEFIPSLASRTVHTLKTLGRFDEALERADEFLEHFPGFTDLVYYQGLAAMDAGRNDEAIAFMEKATTMGDGPSRYTALVGAGTFLPRIVIATIHLNRGEPEKALPQAEWCVEHHREFFAVLEVYALALLLGGHSGAETVATIAERFGELSRTQHFMLGTALFERGFAPEAEQEFRSVLKAQPHSGPARAALVETLLYQKRYVDAATEAELAPTNDPRAAGIVRSELFALLLARELDRVPASLERARAANVATADIGLYETWLGRLRGEDDVAHAPAGSLPLQELMLESLLRVHDFENFELLVGIYADTGLPERERRERLAQMYLRRGFVKSAAREWLTVYENQGPDTHALTGLAHVALASGQPANAHTFATQALALEPGSETLKALVEKTSAATAA